MAASAKRKQEEKHLKMLREMTSLPPNRKCFDCDQRGPTYANMTVGSFVCTSCSGILRGLNPPHRVKSISMTTFTQQEIEFLQKHGNEVCKQIWLGLYDDRTSAVPDFREPQKVKEFLQEKYEKKRWFVPPEQAKVVASVHASISGSSASSTSSTPEVRPLKSLLGESAPTLHLNKTTPSQSPVVSRAQAQQMGQQFQEKKFDLLSDLGGDIFAASTSQTAGSANFANFAHFNSHPAQNTANADFANFDAFGQAGATAQFPSAPQAAFQPSHTGSSSGLANASFANFENFPKSCSADFGSFSSSQSNSAGGPKAAVDSTSVPADRYTALADLNNIFSSAKPDGISSAPASAGVVPPQSQSAGGGGDRYAALAELDNVFSSSAPTSSVYSTSSSAPGSVYGAVTGVTPAQVQQVIPSMPPGFGGLCHRNPFDRCVAASFGTGSMSMPAGFGNTAAFNLPTSFSGTFQQPFPGQCAMAFGQAKPVGAPFGQAVSGPGVSSNPFLAGASAGQFPTGGSSTNPFL
uniref:ArfGAP with FG repeats 1a n=1 Tax=Paramormyrops kingsleyae TaxID=1676925 RepID=A0A3B3TAN3_9TELE